MIKLFVQTLLAYKCSNEAFQQAALKPIPSSVQRIMRQSRHASLQEVTHPPMLSSLEKLLSFEGGLFQCGSKWISRPPQGKFIQLAAHQNDVIVTFAANCKEWESRIDAVSFNTWLKIKGGLLAKIHVYSYKHNEDIILAHYHLVMAKTNEIIGKENLFLEIHFAKSVDVTCIEQHLHNYIGKRMSTPGFGESTYAFAVSNLRSRL